MTIPYLYNSKTLKTFFPIVDESLYSFSQELLKAIEKIDRSFVPRPVEHPYMGEILQGKAGIPFLLDFLEVPKAGTEKGDVFDALANIFLNYQPSEEVLGRLRPYLTNDVFKTIAARTLAIGNDISFLSDVLRGLGSDNPEHVASTALLLGYGRFKPALPALIELLSPTRFVESESILWALGEIGEPSAIPRIEKCIEEGFLVKESLLALGKIGSLSSVHFFLSPIADGTIEDKEVALQALAQLLQKNAHEQKLLIPLGEVFFPLLDQLFDMDDQRVNYFAMLCYARLGGRLSQNSVKKLLPFETSDQDLSSIQHFFTKKK